MNKWVAPIVIVICLILGVVLFLTQSKGKDAVNLPPDSDTFQPISKAPVQGQAQTQGIQDALSGQQNQHAQQQAQQPQQQTQQQQTQELKASYSATIKTSKGDIKVTLNAQAAPHTVINFINKAETNYYNGLIFHRVEDWVIQGGDPKGDGTGGGNIPVEFNNLPFGVGALGMASRGDGKVQNDSQFFIVKTDASWLNGQYTNFGQVTEGMDVVNKMAIGDKILGIQVEGIN